MSSIRQYQRRALEALKPESQNPLSVSIAHTYYLNGEEIYLLGISKGVGTCADLHRINIAVFGKTKPHKSPFAGKNELEQCEWAALLRSPNKKEQQTWFQQYKNTCCMTVQRLKVVTQGASSIHFTLTQDKKVYANTI